MPTHILDHENTRELRESSPGILDAHGSNDDVNMEEEVDELEREDAAQANESCVAPELPAWTSLNATQDSCLPSTFILYQVPS